MKKINFYIVFFTVIIFIFGCDAKIDKKKEYRYIKIKECTIPILKKYKENERGESIPYKYSFTLIAKSENGIQGLTDLRTIEIAPKQKQNILDFAIKTLKLYKVSENKTKHFKNIKTEKITPLGKEYYYFLYTNNTSIQILNGTQEDVDYLVEYCESTWKN